MTSNNYQRLMGISIVFLLSICSLNSTVSLPNSIWSAIDVVSTESTSDAYSPSIAIDSKGNVHVAWREFTSINIFYKFWNATSQIWSATELVSTGSTSSSFYPSLAIDSQDNVYITWNDQTNDYMGSGADVDIFYKFWNATAQSWSTIGVVSTESTETSFSPRLAIDNHDNVHVAWQDATDYLGSGGSDNDIFYKFWNATSQSWSTTEVVSTESAMDSEYLCLAIDGQYNVHVAWNDYTDYLGSGADVDIFYKFRNATSQSWNTTEVVSTVSTGISYYSSMAIDSQDNVHLAWHDFTNYASSGTDVDIFYKFWNATSQIWSPTEVASTESTVHSIYPSLAIDSRDNVHVAWQDGTDYMGSGGSDYDIFYKFWNATSQRWSTTEVVSVDTTGFSESPRLVIDSLDKIHVVWSDNTNYLGSGTDYDVFYKMGINLDLVRQTVTSTETVTGPTETSTETETNTETETSTETDTETETVFGSETLYETSTQIILTTSVITNAKSEVSWSPFFLIPVLIVPLLRKNKNRR